MKNFTIIVAIAKNHAIGKDNQLLWHLSEDLKRFKRLTLEHTVIMGMKTYDSLPVKPFKNRKNIVIVDDKSVAIEGCEMAYSIQEAIDLADNDKENFIIGGGSIYKQFMEIADKMYITVVDKDFEADTFFPEISDKQWKVVEKSEIFVDEKSGLRFSYLTYKKN